MGDNMYTTTGNAKVIKTLLEGMNKLSYDCYHIAIGPDEAQRKEEGITILPITQAGFGDDAVLKFLFKLSQYIKIHKFDYLIFLGDAIHYQKLGLGNLNMEFTCPKTKLIFWETLDSSVRLCMETCYNAAHPRNEIYKAVDHVITTSHYGKEVLEKEFIKVDKVIWEFVDTDLFVPVDEKKKTALRCEYRFKKDDFIFLLIGRNIRRKNHELVVDALYPLMMKYPNIKLHCVIPDFEMNDEANLIDYIRRVKVIETQRDLLQEQRITFCTKDGNSLKLTQGISDEEIIKFHQLSDCFISGTSNEGFNLNFGECLAVGNPYVGVANTTLPELSENGKYADMIDSDIEFNVGGWKIRTCNANKMEKKAEEVYLRNKEGREERSKQGRDYIVTVLNRSKMVGEWVKYLKSLDDSDDASTKGKNKKAGESK